MPNIEPGYYWGHKLNSRGEYVNTEPEIYYVFKHSDGNMAVEHFGCDLIFDLDNYHLLGKVTPYAQATNPQ